MSPPRPLDKQDIIPTDSWAAVGPVQVVPKYIKCKRHQTGNIQKFCLKNSKELRALTDHFTWTWQHSADFYLRRTQRNK